MLSRAISHAGRGRAARALERRGRPARRLGDRPPPRAASSPSGCAASAPTRSTSRSAILRPRSDRRQLERRLPALERAGRSAQGPASDARRPRRPRHLRRALRPELPPLLRRPGDLADRHLDADDGPGVAGADPHPLEHGARRDRRAPDPARAAARALRRRDRRPGRQAPDDDRPAERDGRAGADPRRAHRHRLGPRVGDRRARRCCSASTTPSRTRRASRSCSRWSAPSTCATRSASTPCSSTWRARSDRRSPGC